ncbi:zinc ribbon domain-containing protein [Myxococcus sp. K15C18031901]|uniref:zinc ribbon domain-containing protein n=1 Tax=Myxococcus dinghuensis TaxID=2906761 RepID=UPI0020A708EC|nr:zinc ribbon domain-containing protein [Myxococcus dinghuensis]MCP3098346.1 zinc ribbon domain-containing protein [Myxococcus dinghuensis]
MSMIQFTRNYTDRSNDYGFQFEFFCDKCGNGHMSPFIASTVGMASGVLRAAGSFFGGTIGRAAQAGTHLKDALRGKGWDDAYASAVESGKQHFKNCTRCGKWVCPSSCWNVARGLCEACAPDLAEEAASIQAHVAVEQAREKARTVDHVAQLDMQSHRAVVACPRCGAKVDGGRYCAECGEALVAKNQHCGGCGHELPERAKFCPECGTARGR